MFRQWGRNRIEYTNITDGINSTFSLVYPINFKEASYGGATTVASIYACWKPHITPNTWDKTSLLGYYQTINTTAKMFDIFYIVIGL